MSESNLAESEALVKERAESTDWPDYVSVEFVKLIEAEVMGEPFLAAGFTIFKQRDINESEEEAVGDLVSDVVDYLGEIKNDDVMVGSIVDWNGPIVQSMETGPKPRHKQEAS